MQPIKTDPVLPCFFSAVFFAFFVFGCSLPNVSQADPVGDSKQAQCENKDTCSVVSSEKAQQLSENVKRGKNYIRIYENPDTGAGSLDTSIHHFEGENGFRVDLIGAIHIAEKQYYQKLNKIFTRYDVVLYEVVAEEGTRPDDSGSSELSVIGFAQHQFGNILGLTHQLGAIDYQPQNMVHADMSPTEFFTAMKEREEGFITWYLRSVGYSMGQPADQTDVKVLVALFAPNRQKALRKALSSQMAELGGEVDAMNGPNGSSIITDRNRKVLDQLKKIKEQGKKKVAIFYGAAHLPDMADKLEKEFQLQPKELEWIPAWTF